jgi:hypothetical protein
VNIPKSFNICAIPINVKDVPLIPNRSIIGQAQYTAQKIELDMKNAPLESTEQAFWHEAVHVILYTMNETELRMNEKFVDTFAHLLYQVVKSGKFNVEDSHKVINKAIQTAKKES